MQTGFIHSIESMGLVDGPGVRTVIFMQGCRLRCKYCHNPDTWEIKSPKSEQITSEELIKKIERFKPYFQKNGGVTFSGGEPLLQPDFLIEVLKRCKEIGVHTCLDTAGYGERKTYSEILKYADLVILDIKHYTPEGHIAITGQAIDGAHDFLEACQTAGTPLWIRHVVVPGLTDSDLHLAGFENYLRGIKNIQKVEYLPYHTLGVHKYEAMGIDYPLKDIKPKEIQQ